MAAPKTPKATNTEADQEKLIEVTLSKPHTHKRQRLQPGAKLHVTAAQKEWMESQNLIGEPSQDEAGD